MLDCCLWPGHLSTAQGLTVFPCTSRPLTQMILVLEQSPLMAMASTVCHFTLNSEARLQARGRDLILFSKISGLSRTSLGCLTASLGQGAGLWGMPSGHHLEAIAPAPCREGHEGCHPHPPLEMGKPQSQQVAGQDFGVITVLLGP